MPNVSFSVGHNATNMPHDVALVEALLCVVRRTNGRPYMTQYDGRWTVPEGRAQRRRGGSCPTMTCSCGNRS